MDCFAQLPPEIRTEIIIQCAYETTTSQLMQASPVMLAQYVESKRIIVETQLANLLGGDLHGELVQAALTIIHLPPVETRRAVTASMAGIVTHWEAKTFPNPFEQSDHSTILKLYRLFSRLAVFIEDYLTKATSPFPPRAYLCLPKLAPGNSEMHFKNQTVEMKRVTLDDLTLSERRRFLRSFTQYELLCKMRDVRVWTVLNSCQPGRQILESFESLSFWATESLFCVDEYARGLCGALYAHCTADSWLPDDRAVSTHHQLSPSGRRGLLHPDKVLPMARGLLGGMDLPPPDRNCEIEAVMARSGFDLLTHLVTYAGRTERQGPERLRSWFHAARAEYPRTFDYMVRRRHFFENGIAQVLRPWGDPEKYAPGLRQQLCQRLSSCQTEQHSEDEKWGWLDYDRHKIQLSMYRQRAWTFFDDGRLYSEVGGLSHFPTLGELREHDRLMRDNREARRERRSQQWRDYYSRRSLDSPRDVQGQARQEADLEEDEEAGIPRFFENPAERKLTAFWRDTSGT
ncbi:hypothetical protein ACJ41O_010414 [Fusarium nematophilum]